MQIIKEIKEIGLKEVISKYNLLSRYIDDKVLLRYSQIDSFEFKYEDACMEARGLVLNVNDYSVYSFGFKRFFNLAEKETDFDWDTCRMFRKKDGSLLNLYFDDYNDCWQVSTNGTIYGDAPVNNHALTFKELFWKTANFSEDKISHLNKNLIYNFELCTPLNQVVVYHKVPHLTLLSIKSRRRLNDNDGTYGEVIPWKVKNWASFLKIGYAQEYPHVTQSQLIQFTNEKDGHNFEGVVLVDSKFRRIKLKNEDYCLLHHNMTNINDVALLKIIFKNEGDEIISYFPHLKNRLKDLREKLTKVENEITIAYHKYNKSWTEMNGDRKMFFSHWLENRKDFCIFGSLIEKSIVHNVEFDFKLFLESLIDSKLKKLIIFLDK